MRDDTVLRVEQDLTALEEGEDPAFGVEKCTLLMSPIPGAGLPLKIEDHAPQVKHSLEAEEAAHRHLRRTKIISQMNKALLPLTEGDENFVDAAYSLFRPSFAQKSKELVDQVKAMRSHLPGHKDNKHQFFKVSPPLPTAGGYQYSQKPRRGGNHSGRGFRRSMQGQRPQWNK